MSLRGTFTAICCALAAGLWLAALPATAGGGATCGSGTHGSQGYAYAGHESARVASGVKATLTQLRSPTVDAGHAAAWIGVGGPGAGRNGESVWLQVGLAALPRTPVMIYAEIMRPNREPVFLPLAQNVAVGESHPLAVLELKSRPGVWRVWLDGRPATDPIVLEGSHGRWKPIATAETWNGGLAACNRFAFRFERVGVTRSPGGAWSAFQPASTFRDRGYVVRQLRPAPDGRRTLASDPLAAYAFDAASA